MIGAVLGLVLSLADALAPEPVRVAAAKADDHIGAYVAVAAAPAAVVTAFPVRARRGKRA